LFIEHRSLELNVRRGPMETWPSMNDFLEWTGFIPESGRLLADLSFPYLFLGLRF
jgi:hypothetical protein